MTLPIHWGQALGPRRSIGVPSQSHKCRYITSIFSGHANGKIDFDPMALRTSDEFASCLEASPPPDKVMASRIAGIQAELE